MSRAVKDPLLVLIALLALAGVVFFRLARRPGALLVDGSRPSVDRADRAGPRPVGNDLNFFFLPHHLAISRHVGEFGRPPLWDARGFGGRPLVGNPQAGLFYPPVWPAWWSRAPAALGWITVGHLIWGGLGVYTLSRFLGRSTAAAITAGCVYEASPFLLAHVAEGHTPHVWAAAWHPWAFWAFARARGGDPRGLPILALVLAAEFLAGHPQEWLLLMIALGAWVCADCAAAWKAGGLSAGLVRSAPWIATAALSLGLAAVDLAPQLAIRPWLVRDRSAPGYEPPAHYFLRPINALQLLDPTALGGPVDYFGDDNYWETVCSIGLAPLVLLGVAVARAPDRRQVRGWLLLIGFAVWFACGRALGLYTAVAFLVPGVALIRAPGRALFLANLAASVLAGMGLDALRERGAKAGRGWIMTAALAGLAALAVALDPDRGLRALAGIASQPRVIAVATALAGLALMGRRAPRTLLGLIAVCELAWAGFALIQVAPLEKLARATGIASVLDDGAPFRAPIRVKARDSVYGDLEAVLDGVEKTNLNDSFQLDALSRLYKTFYELASRPRPFARTLPMAEPVAAFKSEIRQAVFDRMSVSALVSDRVEKGCPWPEGARIGPGARLIVARNGTALPRAYVVPGAVVMHENPAVVLSAFREIDPRSAVVMERDPLADLPGGRNQRFKPVRWFKVESDRVLIEVDTDAPGLLVVADAWSPGWTALVDGRPATIERGNIGQRVVALPAPGRHRIEMTFVPPGLVAGAAASAVSAVVWLLFWAATRPRRTEAEGTTRQDPQNHAHGRPSAGGSPSM